MQSNYSYFGQNIALMVLYSSMVQALQDLAGLKCATMAHGEQFVILSGTTEMLALYADSLDFHHMVYLHANHKHSDKPGILYYPVAPLF